MFGNEDEYDISRLIGQDFVPEGRLELIHILYAPIPGGVLVPAYRRPMQVQLDRHMIGEFQDDMAGAGGVGVTLGALNRHLASGVTLSPSVEGMVPLANGYDSNRYLAVVVFRFVPTIGPTVRVTMHCYTDHSQLNGGHYGDQVTYTIDSTDIVEETGAVMPGGDAYYGSARSDVSHMFRTNAGEATQWGISAPNALQSAAVQVSAATAESNGIHRRTMLVGQLGGDSMAQTTTGSITDSSAPNWLATIATSLDTAAGQLGGHDTARVINQASCIGAGTELTRTSMITTILRMLGGNESGTFTHEALIFLDHRVATMDASLVTMAENNCIIGDHEAANGGTIEELVATILVQHIQSWLQRAGYLECSFSYNSQGLSAPGLSSGDGIALRSLPLGLTGMRHSTTTFRLNTAINAATNAPVGGTVLSSLGADFGLFLDGMLSRWGADIVADGEVDTLYSSYITVGVNNGIIYPFAFHSYMSAQWAPTRTHNHDIFNNVGNAVVNLADAISEVRNYAHRSPRMISSGGTPDRRSPAATTSRSVGF